MSTKYKPIADRIIDAALSDTDGYAKLTYLCDRIGNRLAGSQSLQKAIAWSAEQMKKDGLVNVTVQPVMVPVWVRGHESADMIAPVHKHLRMLGLGQSVATPPEGITADVVVVSDFDQLEKLGREKVQGKIVLYNVPYKGYGPTVMYRSAGASRAAALGAAAVLIRSVTSLNAQLPHTGSLNYAPTAPKIPAAAITVEDAMWIGRLSEGGTTVRVTLKMEAHMDPEVQSANVFGDIPGTEHPEEVVVLGGHIDSWDVGQGAQDDGSGVIAALQAVALIKKLDLKPRRTIRVCFWVNEENGLRGGEAYRKALGDKIANHVAAIEMDGGAEKLLGYGYGGGGGGMSRRNPNAPPPPAPDPASVAVMKQITSLFDRLGAAETFPGGGGADIGPLTRDGVPGISPRTVGTHYFDWHHTEADTIDKVDPEEFRKHIGGLAVVSYILADMPGRLAGAKAAAAPSGN